MAPQSDLSKHTEDGLTEKQPSTKKTFIVFGDETIALLVAQELAHRQLADNYHVVNVSLDAVGSTTKIVISEEVFELPLETQMYLRREDTTPLSSSSVKAMYKNERDTLGSQINPYAKRGSGSAAFLRHISRKRGK